jgi:hypothetical protein
MRSAQTGSEPRPDNPKARDLPVSLVRLRGLRLGRCARRILLLAPRPDEEPSVIPPHGASRAAAESHRRAIRCLAANGLVDLTWTTEVVTTNQVRRTPGVIWDQDAGVYQTVGPDESPVRRTVQRRTVRLTMLGDSLVDRLRPILENGRRIRWAAILDSATEEEFPS